jgi:hypothetical protein
LPSVAIYDPQATIAYAPYDNIYARILTMKTPLNAYNKDMPVCP